MIELKNTSFFYDEKEMIFENLNLVLNDNRKYWLKGKNGIGKTTLLKILLGIIKVKKGEAILEFDKEKTLFVPSTPFYEPYMTLNDFLDFYLRKMLKISYNKSDLEDLMINLELLEFRKTLCKDLSKGTIQKIMISPLFIGHKWEYLFLDEPFEHLDMNTCESLKKKVIGLDSFLLIINHKEHLLEGINEIERVYL